ncbi:MAG: SH3 domain-containing protein [Pseudomonadota bacterium]
MNLNTLLGGLCRRTVAVFAVLAVVVQGCAVPVTNEAGDTCVPLRAGLSRIVERYNENLTANIATGAVTGAVAGAGIAAASGGDVGVGLLIGVIAGGLAGAAKGYYENKAAQADNNVELRRAISSDIGTATGYVRTVTADVTRLNSCRLDQLQRLRARVVSGGQGPAEARELANIRRRIGQDQELIAQVVGDVTAGNEIYGEAFARSREIGTGQVAVRSAAYRPRIVGGTRSSGGGGGPAFVAAGPVVSTAYATRSSNVRSGPGQNNAKIGGLASGQSVGVVSGTPGRGWVEINFGGRQGFVFGSLLSTSRPRRAAPAPAAAPVSTSLPVVQVSSRPQGANEADQLLLEAKDLEAGSQAQAAYLNDELNSIDALLK